MSPTPVKDSGWRINELPALSQVTLADHGRVGFKAARLAGLLQAGFSVPAAFCIPRAVYWQHLYETSGVDLDALLTRKDFAAIRAAILRTPLAPALLTDVLAAYHLLTPGPVAVRSSATVEDMAHYSFAGLYESVLGIKDEVALVDAIRLCWASYWSDVAGEYREQAGYDHQAFGMAVLVQVMVEPALAGVLFTQLETKDKKEALVEFVNGPGEQLVNGDVQARRLIVDRDTGRVLNTSARRDELDIRRLIQLGIAVEQNEQCPQDIEWVLDRTGNIWILQTRPITSPVANFLLPLTDADSGWAITYDEPFATLGCEIAIKRYGYWVRAINATFKTMFPAKMRNVDGLLYYNPVWRKAGLPVRLWMRLWQLALWLNAGRVHRRYTTVILPSFLQKLEVLKQADVTELEPIPLLAHFREAIAVYLQFQFTSYPIGAAATLAASILNVTCRHLFGADRSWNALDFLSDISDVSIERELAVNRLGVLLRAAAGVTDDECEAVLATLDAPALLALGEAGESGIHFSTALNRFLGDYGYIWADRYPRDPAWRLNWEAMVIALAHAAQQAGNKTLVAQREQRVARRQEARHEAMASLRTSGRLPWRRVIFQRLLKRAETLFPYKEDRNHHTYVAVMVIRQYAREIGQRLYQRQLLASPEDVFFLHEEEIIELWRSPRPLAALERQVAERKKVYQFTRQAAQRRQPPFSWTIQQGETNGQGRKEMGGEPCSPGRARGPARLVSGLGELQRVQPGDIVVCTQLRPAWASVFARAGGVVVEMGSLLSHGSTLAREYGIPAVINVQGITTMVRDGDWLVVDGNLGNVLIERGASNVG